MSTLKYKHIFSTALHNGQAHSVSLLAVEVTQHIRVRVEVRVAHDNECIRGNSLLQQGIEVIYQLLNSHVYYLQP